MKLENNLKYVLALLTEIEETVLKSLSSQRGSSQKNGPKEINQKKQKEVKIEKNMKDKWANRWSENFHSRESVHFYY